jgi:hypothetical protein
VTRRYGSRSDVRRDVGMARAIVSRQEDRERRAAEACETDPADAEGYDPACRFRDHPLHTCVRRDMELVAGGQPCWYEAQAQVAEQGEVLHAAEDAVQP